MRNKRTASLTIKIAALAAALLLFCLFYRLSLHNTYTTSMPIQPEMQNAEGFHAEAQGDGAFEIHDERVNHGYFSMTIQPKEPGDIMVDVYDENNRFVTSNLYRVSPLMTVYDMGTGGFTGDTGVLIAITLFSLGVGLLMLQYYRKAAGPELYSYSTMYAAGFSLFALAAFVLFLADSLQHFLNPESFSMYSVYSSLHSASFNYMLLTTPLILAFSLLLIISNIALLRHERKRVQNILGILIGLLLIAGDGIGFYLHARNFSGSEWEYRIHTTLQGVYSSVFVFFECMLFGAILCGLRAARHIPAPDQDYIVILGCAFRKDGTLTPLLRGRVDRAIAFAKDEEEKTGKKVIFVPSGGQGKDEEMPEAEAMRNYLLSQGIPKERILPETKSANTYENMAFSRKLIAEQSEDANVIFSTTNYHVFRSGVWASLAGLKAEGIGSKTKWWFWPNAFVRECIGLLLNRWKSELLLLALMVGFFAALTMLLG